MTYEKPLPRITPLSAPFWSAAAKHELRFQRCSSCGHWIYPISPMCQNCWSEEYEWDRASGLGKISSWIVYHRPFHPGFRDSVPYAVVQVDLEEGMRVISNMMDIEPDEVTYGMRVNVAFEDIVEGVSLIKFRPVK